MEKQSSVRYQLMRVRHHWEWGRADGFGRLIEEDDLNPVRRASLALAKWRWRMRQGGAPGGATAVYLFGVQRSGTNMLVRGLEASPEFEVRNENDRRAFTRFRLRVDAVVPLVEASHHRYVLFKPLCDSHLANQLLDSHATSTPSRAIWAYRGVDGRARSAVAKFGTANLDALSQIAAGKGDDDLWQAQGLSGENRELISSFSYDRMTPYSAAALFWLVRNSLYFELGLNERDDVALVSYDAMVADPEPQMRSLCSLLAFPYNPQLVAHIAPRSASNRSSVELDAGIRRRCDEMQERLDMALEAKAHRGSHS